MSQKVALPSCGIFLGSGVYPVSADYLLSTLYAHQSWAPQSIGPLEMLDRIVADNQGNLAQFWGYSRGYAPADLATWLYALAEIGVAIPPPDWENGRYLRPQDCRELQEHAERRGVGALRFAKAAAERGIYTVMLYTDGHPQWSQRLAEAGDYYLGYDFGERFTFRLDNASTQGRKLSGVTLQALADDVIERVREHVAERRAAGWGNIMATSCNFYIDYEIVGGTDIPLVEDFAFCHLNMASALSRGLYRQHGLPLWGSHMAHEHYSWIPNSHPHKFHFVKAHGTPAGQPETTIAVARGNYDLCEHRYQPNSPIAGAFALADINPRWFTGAPERGWVTVRDVFYFIAIPHLSTNAARNYGSYTVDELVQGGDFSGLCGVRVKGRGDCFYWATAPEGSNELGFTFPRRFGIMATSMGDIEIIDLEVETLVVEDELARPLLLRHRYGEGRVYFLNSWAHPGGLRADDGPGATTESPGLIGFIYRHIAGLARGTFWITDDQVAPGKQCSFISYSYFPKSERICLHNADFDRPHHCYLHQPHNCRAIELAPGEFRMCDAASPAGTPVRRLPQGR